VVEPLKDARILVLVAQQVQLPLASGEWVPSQEDLLVACAQESPVASVREYSVALAAKGEAAAAPVEQAQVQFPQQPSMEEAVGTAAKLLVLLLWVAVEAQVSYLPVSVPQLEVSTFPQEPFPRTWALHRICHW